MSVNSIKEAIFSCDREILLAIINNNCCSTLWREAFLDIQQSVIPISYNKNLFHIRCTEFGHKIRNCLGDDNCYIDTLKILLPPYEGNGVQVYRGENSERHRRAQIGVSWTSKIDIARMFGRGLNAYYGGGVLLSAWATPNTIIAGPNDHSRTLGEEEYIVDSRKLERLQLIETYSNLD